MIQNQEIGKSKSGYWQTTLLTTQNSYAEKNTQKQGKHALACARTHTELVISHYNCVTYIVISN